MKKRVFKRNKLLTAALLSVSILVPLPTYSVSKGIQLEITTHLGDNQIFKEGDALSFFVSLDKDAYLLVVYETASGDLIQIIPNQKSRDNYYQAAIYFPIPNRKHAYKFKVSHPFGKERVHAWAANKAFPKLPGKPIGNGLIKVNMDLMKMSELVDQHTRNPNILSGHAVLSLTTTKAGH